MTEAIEVVFSFDTTGSMAPCLMQARRTLRENITQLFKAIPNIKIGIIAHGDYCDAYSTYVTKHFDLSSDVHALCDFVAKVSPTSGGDAPECYEFVLHEARTKMAWTSGKSKVLAMIGDDIPHGPTYHGNTLKIDWRNELGLLLEAGINVYGVQALNRRHATQFYKEIAERTGGFHLDLDQFAQVTDMIMAICYKQAGDEQLQAFEKEVETGKRMSRSMDKVFATLLRRATSETVDADPEPYADPYRPARSRPVGSRYAAVDFAAVPSGRFQVLSVDANVPIKQFAEENGLIFKAGRGFYEFTKSSVIQSYKEIVLMARETGDLFTGMRARELLGLSSESVRLSPANLEKYIPFVQSTSYNRKLLAGTRFLYEVEDWDR